VLAVASHRDSASQLLESVSDLIADSAQLELASGRKVTRTQNIRFEAAALRALTCRGSAFLNFRCRAGRRRWRPAAGLRIRGWKNIVAGLRRRGREL
jgi:hypothetical protein